MSEGEDLVRDIDQIDFSGLSLGDDYFDPNGHLNAGFYPLLMDRAATLIFTRIGWGWKVVEQSGVSMFSLGTTLFHYREVLRGTPLSFRFHLIDMSDKLLHFHLTMVHRHEGWEAASAEVLNICIDLGTRRSRPWPDDMRRRLELLLAVYQGRPAPRGLGDHIGIRRPAGGAGQGRQTPSSSSKETHDAI